MLRLLILIIYIIEIIRLLYRKLWIYILKGIVLIIKYNRISIN
jgi:hypothetical protein